MVVQPDGKIVVGGYFNGLGGGTGTTRVTSSGGSTPMARLTASIPTSIPSAASTRWRSRPMGRSWSAAPSPSSAGTNRANIGRLNADGSLDIGFNPGAETQVLTLGVQTDGKILAGGYFKWLGDAGVAGPLSSVRNYIGRLNADGTVDATFDPGANNVGQRRGACRGMGRSWPVASSPVSTPCPTRRPESFATASGGSRPRTPGFRP